MILRSLTARLLVATSIILASFLSFTGYALDIAFEESLLASTEERLQNHVFTLIAVAELKSDGTIRIPPVMPVARFYQEDDGLYARIVRNDGFRSWYSNSMQSVSVPDVEFVEETRSRFRRIVDGNGRELFTYDFGVSWDQVDSNETFTFNVMESLDEYHKNVSRFRNRLGVWFGGIALVLLAVLAMVLRWSLSPLRQAVQEIKSIEIGEQGNMRGDYPKELQGLTENINGLIQSNRTRLERYRNASADLAHSLKTPLALLQGAAEVEKDARQLAKVVVEQVERMSQIVSYQLQRAATKGQSPLSRPVPVGVLVDKILHSLEKVYRDKAIRIEKRIQSNSVFYGDEADLLELLGNIMDNAFKWARKRISVTVSMNKTSSNKARLLICVEDDGPGIDPTLAARVMERGVRSDGQGGGTGIGLAVVTDIINAYEGSLEVGSGKLGGAQFTIKFEQY